MASFRLATVSAAVSVLSFIVALTSTAAEASPYFNQDAEHFLHAFSLADFQAIPKHKFAEMAADAAQCAVSGVGCGPQVDEFESLLQMPSLDSRTGVHRQQKETAHGKTGSSQSAEGGSSGRLRGGAGKRGLRGSLNQESAQVTQRKMSTQQAIHAAMEQNTHVSQLLRAAVKQEEEATQEAADGKLASSANHNFLRHALEENAAARKTLQSAAQEEEVAFLASNEEEATAGKRARTASQEAIFAALEQNAHLSYALRSAVQQEEAAIQEATRGHSVGAEHNGKLNHGFIYHALQLDEKVSKALQSATQAQEATPPAASQAAKVKRRKATAQEAIYAAMEQEF